MLAFRFANGMFEPIWNRNYIDYVQITAAEDLGIGRRAGLLRQLGRAARPGPEPHAPAAHPAVHGAAGDVRRRRGARREGEGAARRSAPARPRTQVRARPVLGRAWPRARRRWATSRRRACPTTRTTETYAALRLEVDNWRWAGVPIYLRTGKRLARKVTEIAVTLKPVPHLAFKQEGSVGVQPNQLDPDRAAERGRVALARGEDPRHADADPAGEHGVPLRHGVPVAVARGLRAADHGRHARRRRRSSPATTRSRRSGGSSTRSSRRGRQTHGPLPQYAAGLARARRRPTSILAPGHRWRAI